MRRSVGERGGITPIVALSCMALGAAAIGGATLGRVSAVRQDAQDLRKIERSALGHRVA